MTHQQKNNTDSISNKELSIQISLSGLSFCILNTSTNTITYLKDNPFASKKTPFQILDSLKVIFDEDTLLRQNFDTITVVYVNELATLVPKDLFKEELTADYLKFNSKILKTDFISYDEINAIEAINVYVPYININNYLYDRFGTFTYKHFSTILIENLLKKEYNNASKKVYINVNDIHFEIICAKEHKLLLYNTFEYTTKEDFIYYLLFTLEQLNLNPETIELVFIGAISETDDLYKIAFKYIRNVLISKTKSKYNYETTIKVSRSNFTLINSF